MHPVDFHCAIAHYFRFPPAPPFPLLPFFPLRRPPWASPPFARSFPLPTMFGFVSRLPPRSFQPRGVVLWYRVFALFSFGFHVFFCTVFLACFTLLFQRFLTLFVYLFYPSGVVGTFSPSPAAEAAHLSPHLRRSCGYFLAPFVGAVVLSPLL